MLKIPKTKLYIARSMRYGGLTGALLSCLCIGVTRPEWLILVFIYGFMAIMLAGQFWIIALYKCPKCREKLLYRRDSRKLGLEKSCPEYCPSCGERIILEIVDVRE